MVNLDGGANLATYDALGRLVEESANSNLRFYFTPAGAPAGQDNTCCGIRDQYVWLPGGAKVDYNCCAVYYYYHADWLGTARVVSGADQTLWSSQALAPYGEPYGQAGPNAAWAFTGQREQLAGGLGTGGIYSFPFRQYQPTQGRWLSPDPAGLAAVDPLNPQSWNRYSYVYNQPLIYRDDDGQLPDPVEIGVGALIGAAFNGIEQGVTHLSWKAAGIGALCGAAGGAIAGLGSGFTYFAGAAAANACDQKLIDGLSAAQMGSPRAITQDAVAGTLGYAGGEAVGALEGQSVPIALAGVTVAEAAFPLDIAADIFLGSETVPSTHTAVWPMINGKLGTGMISLTVTELDPASQLVSGFDPSAGANSGWLLGGGFNDYLGAQSLFGGGGAWGGVNWYPGMPVTFCFGSLCTDWGSISAHPGPAGQ